MPIPFQDIAGDGTATAVAYLRCMHAPGERCIQGALFVTSNRGDPLEFCYTQVALASGPLWDPGRAHRQAVALLVKALFEAASHLPELVLAVAGETPSEVFSESVAVQMPVGLVGESEDDPADIQWVGWEPTEDSPLSGLVESLRSRNLLLEPLRRAEQGLVEAFANR